MKNLSGFFESEPARLARGHVQPDRTGIPGHLAVLQIADVAGKRKLEIVLSGLQAMYRQEASVHVHLQSAFNGNVTLRFPYDTVEILRREAAR